MQPIRSMATFLVLALAAIPAALAQDGLEPALARSGEARPRWEAALARAEGEVREGFAHLMFHMPDRDLVGLDPDRVLGEVELACETRSSSPWGAGLPDEIFLDHVLPYASATEARDPWRAELRAVCLPLIEGCESISDAVRRINAQVFAKLGVRYSTARRRPDQSPAESIETGLASCTGLSILLVDACRSVGIPARLVGIPRWPDKEGNHTWVEVWDGGWHYTGAAEQDPAGLDRGWFAADAALARKGSKLHAIYAATWTRTGLLFPLPWAPDQDYVHAVDVTDRYARAAAVRPGHARLMIRVDDDSGSRVAASVRVVDAGDPSRAFEGTSRDESADLNDYLTLEVPRGRTYVVTAERDGRTALARVAIGDVGQEILRLALDEGRDPPADGDPTDSLERAFGDWFAAAPGERAAWTFPPDVAATLAADPERARRAAWNAYQAAPIHTRAKEDFAAKRVRWHLYTSPYTVKQVGRKPASGWPLVIAMHGGGGVAKEVNDDQWRVMQIYYRDQPQLGGYLYLALRAPTDEWNGFYTDYVYPLIENLIRQFLLLGEVDPDKVFLIGYSHGGYGAFAIGPKLPHRFAAIHASAAAPTDGQTSARTLRNTPFTYMVGEHDTMYGRLERCRAFDEKIRRLRGDRDDVYPVKFQYVAGAGHGGLPDRDKIRDLYPAVRDPVPRQLDWELTDAVVRDFYWLSVDAPARGKEIVATCRDNVLEVEAKGLERATVWLDQRLVDFARPLSIRIGERRLEREIAPDPAALCESLLARGDPRLAFTARVELELGE